MELTNAATGVVKPSGRYGLTLRFDGLPTHRLGGGIAGVSAGSLEADEDNRLDLRAIVTLDPGVFSSQSDREIAFAGCGRDAFTCGVRVDDSGHSISAAAELKVSRSAPEGATVIDVLLFANDKFLADVVVPIYVARAPTRSFTVNNPASLFRPYDVYPVDDRFADTPASLSLIELRNNDAVGVFCTDDESCWVWRFSLGTHALSEWVALTAEDLTNNTARHEVARRIISSLFPKDTDPRCRSGSCEGSRAAFVSWVSNALSTDGDRLPVLVSQLYRLNDDLVRAPLVLPLGVITDRFEEAIPSQLENSADAKPSAAVPLDLLNPLVVRAASNSLIESSESDRFLAYHALIVTRVPAQRQVSSAAPCVSSWGLFVPSDATDPLGALPLAIKELTAKDGHLLDNWKHDAAKHTGVFQFERRLETLPGTNADGVVVLSHFDNRQSELILFQASGREALAGAAIEDGSAKPRAVVLLACNTGSATDNDVLRAFVDHGAVTLILTSAALPAPAAGAYLREFDQAMRLTGSTGRSIGSIFVATRKAVASQFQSELSRIALVGNPNIRLCGPLEGE